MRITGTILVLFGSAFVILQTYFDNRTFKALSKLTMVEFTRESPQNVTVIREAPTQLTKTFDPSDICSMKPFTAADVWKKNMKKIWLSSIDRFSPPEITNSTVLKDIFDNILSTHRLRKGIRAQPSGNSLAAFHNVMEVVQKKFQDPDAPPLQIAVVGGSVTVGRGCRPGAKRIMDKACAWPHRLQTILNGLAGREIVKVHNLASGGTATDQGTILVKYWMFNKELDEIGPDVIIHSYSTNDSLTFGGESDVIAEALFKRVRNGLQEYARTSIESRPCKPPLLIFVDDYLGYQNTESFLAELSYNTAMTQVANWYGTMAVSYADVVRDLVYRNTDEELFSANWKQKGQFDVEVHFSYTGHAALAWSVAYAMLDAVSIYCDDEYKETDSLGLPPPLKESLRLPTISSDWKKSQDGRAKCTNSSSGNPCEWTFLAAPSQIFDKKKLIGVIEDKTISNTGWEVADNMAEGWRNKLGWEVSSKVGTGSSFELELKDVSKEINVVTIFYLKSYGEKWDNSTATFTLTSDQSTKSVNMLGYHGSPTSITYSEAIKLEKPVKAGESLKVKVELVKGTNFKIFGMMFCSR